MKKIIAALEEFAPLSDDIKLSIASVVTQQKLSKGSLFLEEGKICRHLGFIEQGLLRAYYYRDGKDITTWFCKENDPCLSMSSFITQNPSIEYIEVLEDAIIWTVDYQNLQHLYRKHPRLNLIGRLITEHYYLELESRTLSLQYNTSKERYDRLLEVFPEIIQRAPLTHIASYLGMTRENLSRIRRNS